VSEIIGVVGATRVASVDRSEWRVYIDDHVDTGRVENAGASIMVGLGIDVVYANSIDLDIPSAKQWQLSSRDYIRQVPGAKQHPVRKQSRRSIHHCWSLGRMQTIHQVGNLDEVSELELN